MLRAATGILAFLLCAQPSLAWVVLQQSLPHPSSGSLGLQVEPLIGGPSWLKLHVQVILEFEGTRRYKFDFVPLNPTEPETLQKLVQLQAVPAEWRFLASDKSPQGALEDQFIQKAKLFCEKYDSQLHLISNNCWIFAFQLYRHLMETSKVDGEEF